MDEARGKEKKDKKDKGDKKDKKDKGDKKDKKDKKDKHHQEESQAYPAQGFPPQGFPPQGFPPQGYPPQGYPPQGYPPQGYPPQGYPQGYPPQGYPPQGFPQGGLAPAPVAAPAPAPAPAPTPSVPGATLVAASDGGIPAGYTPTQDAKDLQVAMKGLGTDEAKLIEIIGHRTRSQRQLIRKEFQVQFSKDVCVEIEKETSRHFKGVLLGLLRTPVEVKAHHMYKAIHGLGTDENALIDVVCLSSNHELEEVKYQFGVLFNKPLVDAVKKDTSFNFEKILINLLTRPRDENPVVNQQLAQEDAQRIFKASEGRAGTDEATLNDILTARSPEHIQAINMYYQEFKKGHTLLQAIESETSGHYRSALLALSQRRPTYFARRLHESMAGLGTDDTCLIYILTALEKNEIKQIAGMYKYLFNKELAHDVKGDTTGDYEKILLASLEGV